MAKRIDALRAKVDRNKLYPVTESLSLVKENATAKFNESIDAVVNPVSYTHLDVYKRQHQGLR